MNLRKLGNVQYTLEDTDVGFVPKMGILWTDFPDDMPEGAQKMLRAMREDMIEGISEATNIPAEKVEEIIQDAKEKGDLVDGEDLTLEALERLMDIWN